MLLVRTARRFLCGVREATRAPRAHARADAARAAAEDFLRQRADEARASLEHHHGERDVS